MSFRYPQNGVVNVQDAKVGEIVTTGKSVVSIISDGEIEIEANVSEVNIGKVVVGNQVNMTFDAFANKRRLTPKASAGAMLMRASCPAPIIPTVGKKSLTHLS